MDTNIPQQPTVIIQSHKNKLRVLGIFLGTLVLVIIVISAAIYFLYPKLVTKKIDQTEDTTPKTYVYKPLDSLPELNDCGITQESKGISSLPFVKDFTSRITIAGTVNEIEENTISRLVIKLQPSQGKVLAIPYVPTGNADVLSAKTVLASPSATQKSSISLVKPGDSITITLQCRLYTSRMQYPGSRLETIEIVKSK